MASFLVRLWLELQDGEDGETFQLRGYVRHLQSGEETYFSDTSVLLEFMLAELRDH